MTCCRRRTSLEEWRRESVESRSGSLPLTAFPGSASPAFWGRWTIWPSNTGGIHVQSSWIRRKPAGCWTKRGGSGGPKDGGGRNSLFGSEKGGGKPFRRGG